MYGNPKNKSLMLDYHKLFDRFLIMSIVKIDGKDYEYENLSDVAKKQLNKITYAKKEFNKLRVQMDVLKTAEAAYYKILQKDISENT